MSIFNLDDLFKQNLCTFLSTDNTKITFIIKFAILIDIIVSKKNFKIKSNIKQILQQELLKNSKTIILEYDLLEKENENESFDNQNNQKQVLGILKLEIIDNLIGSFAGKININANFKSFTNNSNQNYLIPINCNSPEYKSLNFNKLNETINPLENFINENLIARINTMNNLNKLTINFNNSNRITNPQTNVFNNWSLQTEKFYISEKNNFDFKSHLNKMDKDFPNVPQNVISGDNSNIHMRNEEIPVDKKLDLGIDENKFMERNKEEIDLENMHRKRGKDTSEDIYQQEISQSNIDNPMRIDPKQKLEYPREPRIPKQECWDPRDPDYEVFNPNYQINPNNYINPNLGQGNFGLPGFNNPFFSSQGGMIPGGELVGPESDIFSKEHPHMQKKPGAKIRYDPIGPFGTFGGPNKGNNNDDPFQG